MSLQMYHQTFQYDKRTSNEILDPNGNMTSSSSLGDKTEGFGAEYVVRLAVRRGKRGKIIKADVPFTLVTEQGYDAETAEHMDNAAADVAADIAALSRGVIINMFKKLGKYRNDELPGFIGPTERTSASIGLCNDAHTDLNFDECDEVGAPEKVVKAWIRIPFARDDMSRQDMVLTIGKHIPRYGTSNNPMFKLGSIQYTTDEKLGEEMVARPFVAVTSARVYDTKYGYSFALTGNDTGYGDNDNVLSTDGVTIEVGEDDATNSTEQNG